MKRGVDYGLLIALAVVAHGLLLLNDGIYWDDWYLYTALHQHNWPAIALLGQRGLPTDPILYWIIGYGGRVFAFKLVKFIALTLVAILVYEVCSLRFSRGIALAIAALALTFPGDETTVILMTTDYAVYYAIFWIAVWLAFRDSIPLFCIAVALFLLSFNLNSLLVFYFGFVIAIFQRRKRDIVFISLPFVFWGARLLFFAPKGYFASYNNIDFRPASLIRQTLQYVYFGGLQTMIVPIVLLISAVFIIRSKGSKHLLLYALLLGLLAIFPYAAVHKAPNAVHGPNTRCELLLAFPVALLIVSAMSFPPRRFAQVVLAIVLIAFTAQTIRTYLAWQAEWAKERALIASLAQQRDGARFETLFVCDNFDNDPYFMLGIDALLLKAWDNDSRVWIDPRWDPTNPRFAHPDELQTDRIIVLPWETGARTADPIGTLSLCSPRANDARVAAAYLRDRFFQPEHLPTLFAGLAHAEVRRGRLNRACCP